MPIITPAYPSMCATYNITKSAMAVIQNELDRGAEISDKIMMGKAKWNDLFVKHTFFTSGYKYYLAVVSASTTKESHITWSGLVESKVRVLVQLLERHPSIAIAQAFNKGYERTHRCKSEKEVEEAREGSVAYMVKDDEASMTAADKREAGSTEAASSNGLGPIAANSDGSGENPAVRREMPDGTHATDGMNQDTNTRHQIKTDEAADPTVTYVYTTTHYIGLELNEGECSATNSSSRLVASLCLC